MRNLLVILILISPIIFIFLIESDFERIAKKLNNQIILKRVGQIDTTELKIISEMVENHTNFDVIIDTTFKIDCDSLISIDLLDEKLYKRKSLKYLNTEPIEIYVCEGRLRYDKLKVHGICYGNRIYMNLSHRNNV
jgi:hypothetical protein